MIIDVKELQRMNKEAVEIINKIHDDGEMKEIFCFVLNNKGESKTICSGNIMHLGTAAAHLQAELHFALAQNKRNSL